MYKVKNNDFIQMVSDDIKRCDEAISSGQNINSLLNELVGKYSKVSLNFPDIEMNALLFRMHPNVPKENLLTIQGFLKAYLLNNCEDYRFDEPTLPKLNDFRSENQAVIRVNDRHILYVPYYF